MGGCLYNKDMLNLGLFQGIRFFEAEAKMMMLNFEELKESLTSEKRDGLLKNFYQATAEILVRKLVSTNQLAKTYRAEHDI
jgi:hypothetical protein